MCFEKWLNRYMLPMLLGDSDFVDMLKQNSVLVPKHKPKKFFKVSNGFCYFDVANDDVDRFLSLVVFGYNSVRIKKYFSHGVINKKKVMALIEGWKRRYAYFKFLSPKKLIGYDFLYFYCSIDKLFIENNAFEIHFVVPETKIAYENLVANSKIARGLIPYCKNFVFRTEASPEEFETMLKILCIL